MSEDDEAELKDDEASSAQSSEADDETSKEELKAELLAQLRERQRHLPELPRHAP